MPGTDAPAFGNLGFVPTRASIAGLYALTPDLLDTDLLTERAAAAPALVAAGADALAVISAVFDAPDVAAAAKAFRDAFSARQAPAWQRARTT